MSSLNIFIGTNSFQAADISDVDAGTLDLAPNFTTIDYTVTTHLAGSYLTDMLASKVGMAVSANNFTDFTQNDGSYRIDDIRTYQHTAGTTLDFNTFPDIGMAPGILTGEFDPSYGSDNIIIDSNRQVGIDTTMANQVASALPKALGRQMPLSGGKDDIFRIMVNEDEYKNLAKFAIKDLGATDITGNTVSLQSLIHSANSNAETGITYGEIDQAWHKTIDQRNVGHEILSSVFRTSPATPENTNTGVGATWEHENDDYLTLKRLPQNVNLQFVLKTELSIVNDAGVPLVGTSMSPSYATGQTSFDSAQPSVASKRVLILYNFIFNEAVAPVAAEGTIEGTAYDGLVTGADVFVNGELVTTTSNVGTYTLSNVSGTQNIEISGGIDQDTGAANDLVLKLRILDGGNASGMRYVTPLTTIMTEAYEQDNNIDEDELLTRMGLTDSKSLEDASMINPDDDALMRKTIMKTVSLMKTIRAAVGDDAGAKTAKALAETLRTEDAALAASSAVAIGKAATSVGVSMSAANTTALVGTLAATDAAIDAVNKISEIADIHQKIVDVAADIKTAISSGAALSVVTIPCIVLTGNVHPLVSGADLKQFFINKENAPIIRFNGELEFNASRQYSLTAGRYRVKNVPMSYAICLFDNSYISCGEVTGKTKSTKFEHYQLADIVQFPVGGNNMFFYGDFDLICSGPFTGSIGLVSIRDFQCGCESVFVYDADLLPPGAPALYPKTLPADAETKLYNVYQWPFDGGTENPVANDAEMYTATSLTPFSANVVFKDAEGNEIKVVPNDLPYDRPSAAKSALINGATSNISVTQIALPVNRAFEVIAETNPKHVQLDPSGYSVRLPNYVRLAIEEVDTATIVYTALSCREESGIQWQASLNSLTERFSWQNGFISDGTVAALGLSTAGTYDSNTGIVNVVTRNDGAASSIKSHCSLFRLSETPINVEEINMADPLNSALAFPEGHTNLVRWQPVTFNKDGVDYWLDGPMHNTGVMGTGLSLLGVQSDTLVVKREPLRTGESQEWSFDTLGVLPGKYAVVTDGPWWTQNPEGDSTYRPGRKTLSRSLDPANVDDMANSAFVFEVPETAATSNPPNYCITPRWHEDTGAIENLSHALGRCVLRPLDGQNSGEDVVISFAGRMNLKSGDGVTMQEIYPSVAKSGVGLSSYSIKALNTWQIAREIYLEDGRWQPYHIPDPLCRAWRMVDTDSWQVAESFTISRRDPDRSDAYRYCYITDPNFQYDTQGVRYRTNRGWREELPGYGMLKTNTREEMTGPFDASSNVDAVFDQWDGSSRPETWATNARYDYINESILVDITSGDTVEAMAAAPPMGLWKLMPPNVRNAFGSNQHVNKYPDVQVNSDEYFVWADNGDKLYCEKRIRLQHDSDWYAADYSYSIPTQPNSMVTTTFKQVVKLPPGDYLVFDHGQTYLYGRSSGEEYPTHWNASFGQFQDRLPGSIFTIPQYAEVDFNPIGGFMLSNVQASNVNVGDRLIMDLTNNTHSTFRLYRDEYRTKEVTLDDGFSYQFVSANDAAIRSFPNLREYRIPLNISTGILYYHGGSITISDWVASEVGNVEGYSVDGVDDYTIDRDENVVTESDLQADDLEHVISS